LAATTTHLDETGRPVEDRAVVGRYGVGNESGCRI
jgi:hypothetical protein